LFYIAKICGGGSDGGVGDVVKGGIKWGNPLSSAHQRIHSLILTKQSVTALDCTLCHSNYNRNESVTGTKTEHD
jgi:hypothetical protein